MLPIYRQEDIEAFDRSLSAGGLLEEAISRAGFSVFSLARQLLGGMYGKRVAVIFGPGNNGRDALVAARHMRSVGAVVSELRYGSDEYFQRSSFAGVDLVVDGCFGVGLSRAFSPPPLDKQTPVLAVDIPSGLDGSRGSIVGAAMHATATLNLSGLKTGAVISDGPEHCGDLYLSELGLGEVGPPRMKEFLVEDSDLATIAFGRSRKDHKWSHSVAVIAGSPGMDGAAHLACTSGYYVGAGIVHLYTDTSGRQGDYGIETVVHSVDLAILNDESLRDFFGGLAKRFKSLVIGPGLGLGSEVRRVVEAAIRCKVRTVIDADAITSIPSTDWLSELVDVSHPGVILTPHRGELMALLNRSGNSDLKDNLQTDLCSFVRRFTEQTGTTLLVKGGPTLVGSSDGSCYITTAPDASLAVAGSGDVLAGIIGAALSYEGDVARLTAAAAHLHGLAGRLMRKGPSGDIARMAREVLLRFEDSHGQRRQSNFLKPTIIGGNLVASLRLVGDHS